MNIIHSFDPKLKDRSPNDLLLQQPVIVVVNKFDEESARKFREQFSEALNTGQKVVPVVIDSYGGQCYSLLSMIDTIKSSPIPVATIATGKAMSCGIGLLTCGTEGLRFASPNATLMMHDTASMAWGKIEDIKVATKEIERLQKTIFTMLARNCGKADDYFLTKMDEHKHADWFMDPKEAMEHNIVNHIRVPNFKISVSVDYSFE